MQKARCLKCGFTISGVWRKGPPKACPVCGFDRSDEVVARANAHKAEAAAYTNKNRFGRLMHRVGRVFRKREEPIV